MGRRVHGGEELGRGPLGSLGFAMECRVREGWMRSFPLKLCSEWWMYLVELWL